MIPNNIIAYKTQRGSGFGRLGGQEVYRHDLAPESTRVARTCCPTSTFACVLPGVLEFSVG